MKLLTEVDHPCKCGHMFYYHLSSPVFVSKDRVMSCLADECVCGRFKDAEVWKYVDQD